MKLHNRERSERVKDSIVAASVFLVLTDVAALSRSLLLAVLQNSSRPHGKDAVGTIVRDLLCLHRFVVR